MRRFKHRARNANPIYPGAFRDPKETTNIALKCYHCEMELSLGKCAFCGINFCRDCYVYHSETCCSDKSLTADNLTRIMENL